VLCVTHGVFSKGLMIDGIDSIYCTDSYQARALEPAAIEAADLTCSTEARQDLPALRVRRGDTVILTQLQNFVANLLSPTAALRAH
jgi:hypothetical protein